MERERAGLTALGSSRGRRHCLGSPAESEVHFDATRTWVMGKEGVGEVGKAEVGADRLGHDQESHGQQTELVRQGRVQLSSGETLQHRTHLCTRIQLQDMQEHSIWRSSIASRVTALFR